MDKEYRITSTGEKGDKAWSAYRSDIPSRVFYGYSADEALRILQTFSDDLFRPVWQFMDALKKLLKDDTLYMTRKLEKGGEYCIQFDDSGWFVDGYVIDGIPTWHSDCALLNMSDIKQEPAWSCGDWELRLK